MQRWRLAAAAAALVMIAAPAEAPKAQAPAATVSALPFVLTMIGPGVYAAINGPERKAGSNAGFVIGDEGVLVVDSFLNPESARALLGEIRRITPKPIKYLVNTHYHLDHVLGDGVFHDAGAILIAHRNVHGWIRSQNIALLESFGAKVDAARRAEFEALPEPDIGVEQPTTVWLGSRRIELLPEKGHTGGDVAVAIPDAHVLFCGDLLWKKTPPTIVDSNVRTAVAELAAFRTAPDAASTTFVPGHGDLATVKDVAEYQAFLTDLDAATAAARKAGLKGDAEIAAVTARLKPRYADWTNLERATPAEVKAMDAELAGTKTVPVPAKD
jgi:glyoxylase-like metal-dependent hydrolase (beta-lactamase superfamily II)